MAEVVIKILAELIVVSALNLMPLRRLKSIDGTLKALRRDLSDVRARHGRRLARHTRRLNLHDDKLGMDTKKA